jgi:peptidylprolyl isomerase
MKVTPLRKVISIALASLVMAASLAGCASAPKANTALDAPMVCQHYTTGSTADQITADIPATGAPTIKFPTPLTTKVNETKVLQEGTGPRFGGNQQIKFELAAYDAATGKQIQSTKWNDTDAQNQVISEAKAGAISFCNALGGVREGSVVATIFNAKDSHGGQAYPADGIGKNDSLIFVFKLLQVDLPKAQGDALPAQDGFPQVVSAENGTPGLVMQDWSASAAPKQFKAETLIQGKGAVVKLNDIVSVHYSGFLWDPSKTMFDSSWTKGAPATFGLTRGALIPGFIKALVGQRVGSRVVAILPPSYGYGSSASGSIPANSTLIFVIDIVGKGK